MKVWLDKKDRSGRVAVDAKIIENRKTTILVELADGNRITRKKKRDIVAEVQA